MKQLAVNADGARFALALFHSVSSIAKAGRIHKAALSAIGAAMERVQARMKVPVTWVCSAAGRLNRAAGEDGEVGAELQEHFARMATAVMGIRRTLQRISSALSLFTAEAWVVRSSPLLCSSALQHWFDSTYARLLRDCRVFVQVCDITAVVLCSKVALPPLPLMHRALWSVLSWCTITPCWLLCDPPPQARVMRGLAVTERHHK